MSVTVHVVVALLFIVPFATHVVQPILQGAGGPGPAGGGGGGRAGTGGDSRPVASEGLQFIQVAPDPPPVVTPTAPTSPPVVPLKPLEAQQPKPLAQPTADSSVARTSPLTSAVAPAPGSGGGTGTDGTNGTGPGSGGGTGTGVGTGRGSSVGPGTGGGSGANYPPMPIEMFLPPIPVPDRLRGVNVIAEFDVDETGRVVSFTFTETKDGGYNRRLRDVVRSIRFKPGSRPDGTPVRMKTQIEWRL